MFGLPLAFAAPAVLAALIGLAALYWLLRVTPPRPREEAFPPLRLLLGLVDKDTTPAKTPWPLLALRLAIAAAVVLAMAGPMWNAAKLRSRRDRRAPHHPRRRLGGRADLGAAARRRARGGAGRDGRGPPRCAEADLRGRRRHRPARRRGL